MEKVWTVSRFAWLYPWHVSHAEISWKIDFSWELGLQNKQNRFADANRPPPVRTPDVTRRDGSSSWRVILFVAAGMLSGKWGPNYVANMEGKLKISHERTWSFSPGVFFQLTLILYFCACKTSAQSIGYGKRLNWLKVCMVSPVACLTCWNFMKNPLLLGARAPK